MKVLRALGAFILGFYAAGIAWAMLGALGYLTVGLDEGASVFGALGGLIAIVGGVLMARRSLRKSRERTAAEAG